MRRDLAAHGELIPRCSGGWFWVQTRHSTSVGKTGSVLGVVSRDKPCHSVGGLSVGNWLYVAERGRRAEKGGLDLK